MAERPAPPQPRFQLRGRSSGEQWDLALAIFRRHALTIMLLALPGVVVTAVALEFALRLVPFNRQTGVSWLLLALMLAGPMIALQAPLTAWLGEAVFQRRPDARRVMLRVRQAGARIVVSGGLRLLPGALALVLTEGHPGALFVALLVQCLLMHLLPWQGEVLVLEGGDAARSRARCRALARQAQGQQFALILLELGSQFAAVALACLVGGEVAGWFQDGLVWAGDRNREWDLGISWWPWIGLWPAVAVAAVVRTVTYLGQRTIGEGWDVETTMRVAGATMRGGRGAA